MKSVCDGDDGSSGGDSGGGEGSVGGDSGGSGDSSGFDSGGGGGGDGGDGSGAGGCGKISGHRREFMLRRALKSRETFMFNHKWITENG